MVIKKQFSGSTIKKNSQVSTLIKNNFVYIISSILK